MYGEQWLKLKKEFINKILELDKNDVWVLKW